MSALMSQDHTLRVLVSNVPTADASSIARALVDARHAACVNILPAHQSVYIWEGDLIEEQESCLLIKTTQASQEACVAHLIALHPYTTPEVLSLTPQAVHALYAAWVDEVVGDAPPSPPPREEPRS